jgi:hypothetical protein
MFTRLSSRLLSRRSRLGTLPGGLQWRGVLARLLLGFMLVAAQQGALLHALGHDIEAVKHGTGKSLPERHDCCIAFHGLDHAVASLPSLPPVLPHAVAYVAQTFAPVLPPFHAHFRSRAPPSSEETA